MNTMERKQLGLEKARQLATGLGSAVELMTGESARATTLEASFSAWQKASTPLSLRCTFGFTEAPLWIIADEQAWSDIAEAAVSGAGIEDANADLRKQTWRELISQAANPLIADRSQDPAVRLNVEELPAASVEQGAEVFAVELTFGTKTFAAFHVLVAKELIDAFAGNAERQPKEIAQHLPPTLDRLLDVELSLSVSFGRTSVPVQDILKMSSGSIVELNCRANDLVEIIVNDCMIARGEVVVIEGNYGVRVREIISRSERMALSTDKGYGPGAMKLSA